jgi:hypothetical protein
MSAGKWEIGDHLSDRNLRKNNEVNVVKVIRLTNHDTVAYRADEHVAYKRPIEPPFMSTEAIQRNRPVHMTPPMMKEDRDAIYTNERGPTHTLSRRRGCALSCIHSSTDVPVGDTAA